MGALNLSLGVDVIAFRALLVLAVATSVGCGPTCQSSCQRLYLPEPKGCDIQVPGESTESLLADCVDQCTEALATTGELGDFNPRRDEVTNEKQAASWMDCVAETSCENLDPRTGGYCAPL